MALAERSCTPLFGGATEWLNTGPLGPAELRGHVVLVDFWTLTCINWLRTAPHIRAWSRAYLNDGLIVAGVHTPEFSFERDVDRVRRATNRYAIDYPVAIDNGFAIWTAFDNHYWPAIYLVDGEGVIRDHHFGEGRNEQTERVIQRLLGIEREMTPVQATGVEADADWDNLRTPETYLGYQRSERFASPGGAVYGARSSYRFSERERLNRWSLDGDWTVGPENITLDRAGGSIAFTFHARDVHLVMSPGRRGPIPFRVLLDGQPPAGARGEDIDEQGNGVVEDGRLYQLIRVPGDVLERTVEITFLESGAEGYSFTFG